MWVEHNTRVSEKKQNNFIKSSGRAENIFHMHSQYRNMQCVVKKHKNHKDSKTCSGDTFCNHFFKKNYFVMISHDSDPIFLFLSQLNGEDHVALLHESFGMFGDEIRNNSLVDRVSLA